MPDEKRNKASARARRFVMVVDDHELVRKLIVAHLEKNDIEVLAASSGPSALELYRARGPEIGCVLQDLSMPGMRGEAVITELRLLDPDARILAMSVDPEEVLTHLPWFADMDGFVQKPFTPDALIDKVRQQLGK